MEKGDFILDTVEPIRDPKKINAIKNYLKWKSIRDYALFVVGINVALSISDLLSLTWGDVLERGDFKTLSLKEGKTQKMRNIKLNQASRKALQELLDTLATYEPDDYIFV